MIGIISDTHEQVDKIKKAVKIFKKKKVRFVVHCGDIISPPTLKLFKGLKMKVVFGNNDGERVGLNVIAKDLGFEEITDLKKFVYKGKRFFVCHNQFDDEVDFAIKDQEYDFILAGHTHKVFDRKKGITRVINPGSLFSEEPSIATLNVDKDKVKFIKI